MYEWEADLAAEEKAFLERDAKRQAELEANKYDGVLGLPPKWVPPPVLEQFRKTRDLMLQSWGYTPEEAIKWVNKEPEYGKELKNLCDHISPNGRSVEYWAFQHVINYLSNLRSAVSLGPEEGLKKLSGDDAVRGYKTISSASKGGNSKARLSTLKKEKVRHIASQIIEKRQIREPSKRELARLVVREVYPELRGKEAEKKADVVRRWL